MRKTILVPTDFSKNASNALHYAIALAKKENSKLILLHAFRISYPTSEISIPVVIEEVSEIQKESEEKLMKLCNEISKKKKIKCEFICKEGLAMDVVLETSKKKRPSFIVMGTKGASGIKEIILGSNTAKIIEKSNCPVIAVPESASFKGIKKILFATNYKESDIAALKKLVEIAKDFNSNLSILHVANEEYTKEAEKGLMQLFIKAVSQKIKYSKITYQIKYGKSLEKVMQNYIKKESPDIIAMSTLRRNLIEKLFGISITKKMAYHTKVPLLAFHHKKESHIFI
jgi:nucleotide-binding universal stress UspA family protein